MPSEFHRQKDGVLVSWLHVCGHLSNPIYYATSEAAEQDRQRMGTARRWSCRSLGGSRPDTFEVADPFHGDTCEWGAMDDEPTCGAPAATEAHGYYLCAACVPKTQAANVLLYSQMKEHIQ